MISSVRNTILVVFGISLALAVTLGMQRYADSCEGSPSLVAKYSSLSAKRQAKLDDSLKAFEEYRATYYEQIDALRLSRSNWLNNHSSTDSIEKQSEMLHLGAGLLQKAIETYALWNDGLYPENPDALMCPDLLLLGGFYENPFMNGESFNVSISKPSDGDFAYIPEYDGGTNFGTVIGYWLIIFGNESINDPNASSTLIKQLPGNMNLPKKTFVVLETH